MTATKTIKPTQDKTVASTEKVKRLINLAERDSLRRDFEMLRERHGLAKNQSPK